MTKAYNIRPTMMTALITVLALSACASGGGAPDGPFAVANDSPPPPPSNTNITVLSAGNPDNFVAVDETFDVAASFITVRENAAGGFDLVSRNRSDFRNPGGTVFFNAEDNTLTFDVEQGNIDINEQFGPIVLSDPADFPNLDFDQLSILASSTPESFPSIPGNINLPFGAQNLEDLRGNPEAIELFVEDLQRISGGQPSAFGSTADPAVAADFLASLNEVTASIVATDFVSHQGTNGSRFIPLNLRDNNSGVETSYVTLGIWRDVIATDAAANDVTFGNSVFGLLTPPEEVPTTGTASYDTTILGFLLRNNRVDSLRGSVAITANFETRMVDLGILSTIANSDADGMTLFTDFVELTGEGLLTGGNRFDGDLRGVGDQSIRGEVAGAFFGPLAVEVGGTFRFGNDDFEASGAFAGTQQGSGDGTP